MKMRFKLKSVSGRELAERFLLAIAEDGVGRDDHHHSYANLFIPEGGEIYRVNGPAAGDRQLAYRVAEGDACLNPVSSYPTNYNRYLHEELVQGPSWVTAFSGFRYTILNADDAGPALVEYEGACAGFLRQNLIPNELRDIDDFCQVTGRSVVERLGQYQYPDPVILLSAYALLQNCSWKTPGKEIWEDAIMLVHLRNRLGCFLSSQGHDWTALNRVEWVNLRLEDDELSYDIGIRVYMVLAGRDIFTNFKLDRLQSRKGWEEKTERDARQ